MCAVGVEWTLTDFVSLLDGGKMVSFYGLYLAPWWALGVVDLGRRRVFRVDRAPGCVDRAPGCADGEKTENAKPGDRSPCPRYYYGVRGIFESFTSTFWDKTLISILNIVALMDRSFQNRAAGSVTA